MGVLELLGINPVNTAVINSVAEPFAGRITQGIPEDCSQNHCQHDEPWAGCAGCRNGACHKKKRISRQKRHDNDAGLQEKDHEHCDVDKRAVVSGD